jgi:diadenosine tetraphosphate (Ap4A) HIT family hydrolase
MESFYACTSSTIHIQNSSSEGSLRHLIIHVIPRKAGDLKSNDQIYRSLDTYPEDLLKHYNEKMNFYINAYANKILEGLNEQARKYESHVAICFKEEREV